MSTNEILESYVLLKRKVALLRAAEIKDLDFGHNQVSVLYRLSISDANMGELAEYTSSDKASMSRTVALLEKQGLVRRVADSQDRRVSNIMLTAKGRAKAQRAKVIRDAIGERLNDCLSKTEKQQFVQLVSKIVNKLETHLQGSKVKANVDSN